MSETEPAFTEADRDAYAESKGNPLYALSAMLHSQPGQPLPDWLHAAMQKLARGALDLEREHWNDRGNPKATDRALKKLPAALGFVRRGWSAFHDQAERNEAAWTALDANYFAGMYGNRESAYNRLREETKQSRSTILAKIAKARKSGLSRD